MQREPSDVVLLLSDINHKLGTYDELVDEITETLRDRFPGAVRLKGRFTTPSPDPDQYCWYFTLANFYARQTIQIAIEEIVLKHAEDCPHWIPELKWVENRAISFMVNR